MGSRRLLALVVIVLLALSILSVYTVLGGLLREPGLYLEFKLYNYNAFISRVWDPLSSIILIEETRLLSRPDAILFLEVTAIAPPTFKEDLVVVHRAAYRGSNIVFIPLSKLYSIAEDWVKAYESRRGDPEKTYSGLILRVFILNVRTREILYELYDSITYKPIDIVRGRSLGYTIHLARSTPKALKVDAFYTNPFIARKLSVELGFKNMSSTIPAFYDCICNEHTGSQCYCRELVLEVKPEDLTSVLPSSYFTSINGKLYVKTPVLIAWNKYNYSGSVDVSISIGAGSFKVGVHPTLASGRILSSVLNGILPDVPLWRGSGFTWYGEDHIYGHGYVLVPNAQWWAWIWTRPVFRIYKVYYCFYESSEWQCKYVKDDAGSFIIDILTNGRYGRYIQGGYNFELPHEALMSNFYKGINLTKLTTPGRIYLDDGKLDPGEFDSLGAISWYYYKKCGVDLEIGIPVGVIVAVGVCRALTASLGPIDTQACSVAQNFLSAFNIILPSIYTSVLIGNHGDEPGIPGDYNVPEYVYVGVSRYKYHYDIPPPWCFWCPPAPRDYNILPGIYFEFH